MSQTDERRGPDPETAAPHLNSPVQNTHVQDATARFSPAPAGWVAHYGERGHAFTLTVAAWDQDGVAHVHPLTSARLIPAGDLAGFLFVAAPEPDAVDQTWDEVVARSLETLTTVVAELKEGQREQARATERIEAILSRLENRDGEP